jgi:hypothetical protein
MSLPSTARHRWGLEDGGDVGFLDLGDAIVIVPGGTDVVRRKLLDAITHEDWQFARAGFGEDELTSQ